MAKSSVNIPALCGQLVEDARAGVFKPVYLLMGDEPYYPDLVCAAVMEHCVDESFKDFNEYVYYGADTDAETVVSSARQYPMMSDSSCRTAALTIGTAGKAILVIEMPVVTLDHALPPYL